MKVKLNRKIKVLCLPCEVEVDEMEAHRLMLLNAIEVVSEKEVKTVKRETRKKKEIVEE